MTRATLARALFARALAAGAGSERGAAGGTQSPIVPTFSMVSYIGKCLDFGPPPQLSGGPVFINACNGTHAQQVDVQEIK